MVVFRSLAFPAMKVLVYELSHGIASVTHSIDIKTLTEGLIYKVRVLIHIKSALS